MADQTAQQSQQQQQNMAPTPTHDERLVACVKRIWKSDQANAERILSNLSNVIGAVQKEQDPVKREGLQKKIQSVKNAAILFQQFARQGNSFVPEIAAEVAVHAAMHNTNPSQLYPSTLQRFLQQQQQQQQQGAGQQQQQPQQQEPSRMEGVVATPSWPNKISDPEEHIKMVSKDPTAHMDPGPVAFPALRPTLTGGVPLGIQNGTPAHILPPPDDPSIYVPDIRPTSLRKNQAAEQHVRKKIQELVSTVDPTVKVDAEAEDLLLEIADEFIDSVANFACRLATHRGSQNLDVRDLQLHLEMHHGIRIPGFSVDPPSQSHAASGTQGHSQAATGGGGGGGANKKGGAAAAAAAGIGAAAKRSSRLAAVNQAKKEARLL